MNYLDEPVMQRRLLNIEETANYLGISVRTIYNQVCRKAPSAAIIEKHDEQLYQHSFDSKLTIKSFYEFRRKTCSQEIKEEA